MAKVARVRRLLNKRERYFEDRKRDELINRLDGLEVIVNRPREMGLEQLEMLVNRHRTTIEARPDYIPSKIETPINVNVDKEDVATLVNDLGWETKQAVKHQTRKEERKIRNQKRVQLLQEINRLEVLGESEKVAELGKMLVNL